MLLKLLPCLTCHPSRVAVNPAVHCPARVHACSLAWHPPGHAPRLYPWLYLQQAWHTPLDDERNGAVQVGASFAGVAAAASACACSTCLHMPAALADAEEATPAMTAGQTVAFF